MESVAINTPDASALNKSAEAFLASARAMTITSQSMYGMAANELQAIKAKTKDLDEQRTGIVKPLNEAVKRINDLFRAPLDFLGQAERVIKNTMITFNDQQEAIRREEERKAQAIAEAERARLASLAAQAAAKAREEEARIRQEAADAAAAGDAAMAAKLESKAESTAAKFEQKAEDLRESAAMVQAAPIATIATKTAGISSRGVWKGEVIDKMALIKYVAANPQFANLIEPNDKAINAMAKALKENLNVDGVRVWEEKTIAARSA